MKDAIRSFSVEWYQSTSDYIRIQKASDGTARQELTAGSIIFDYKEDSTFRQFLPLHISLNFAPDYRYLAQVKYVRKTKTA